MKNSKFIKDWMDTEKIKYDSQLELNRVSIRLDKLAVPTKNNGIEMSVTGRLDWLINHYNLNADGLTGIERLERLNSDISSNEQTL